MSSPHVASRPRALALERVGVFFIGLAFLGAGFRQVVTRTFVRIAPGALDGRSWHGPGAIAVGVVLIAVGGFILAHGWRARAAWIAAGLLIADLIALQLPPLVSDPTTGYLWTNPAKLLCLGSGAVLVAARQSRLADDRARWIAIACAATFLVLCGIQHFVYAGFVDTLVPAWVPPHARFWTYFTAAALVLGGIGLCLPRTTAAAALCSAVMIGLWVLVLHIPRTISLGEPSEFDGACEATAISGTMLVIYAATVARPRSG